VPFQAAAEQMGRLLEALDTDADLVAFSENAARSMRAGDALSDRQAVALDQICLELMCSSEIVRCSWVCLADGL
jgi:hypothetical protein